MAAEGNCPRDPLANKLLPCEGLDPSVTDRGRECPGFQIQLIANRFPLMKRLKDPPDDCDTPDGEEPFGPDAALPGAVVMVPNRHWGFEVVSAVDHPGACTHYRAGEAAAILLKGTDAGNAKYPRRYYVVDGTRENGLHKPTAFELVPRLFRLHKVKLLFPERHLGRLDEATLHALRAELARLHPEE